MEDRLNEAVSLIAKVVDGQNLTTKEAERVFKTIFLYDKEGYHFLALIAALHAKGETEDELLGLVKTHLELGEKLEVNLPAHVITDLSGSGGGKIKTFNVSTTASFIVAAAGFAVLKNAYWAVTGLTGSADVFEAFGIDIKKLTKEKITETLQEVGICPIFYPLISPKLKNRGRLSRKIFIEKGIKIKTPFHLVTNIISPIKMKYRIYGLYDKRYLETIARLFTKLGYKKTLTFWSEGNFPEISNFGRTIVVEQEEDEIKKYELTPEDMGVCRVKVNEITTSSKEENILTFLRILTGKEKGPKSDLAAINAGASLYVSGKVKSIREGVSLAKEIIEHGVGFEVLEKLVTKIGDKNQLKFWIGKLK